MYEKIKSHLQFLSVDSLYITSSSNGSLSPATSLQSIGQTQSSISGLNAENAAKTLDATLDGISPKSILFQTIHIIGCIHRWLCINRMRGNLWASINWLCDNLYNCINWMRGNLSASINWLCDNLYNCINWMCGNLWASINWICDNCRNPSMESVCVIGHSYVTRLKRFAAAKEQNFGLAGVAVHFIGRGGAQLKDPPRLLEEAMSKKPDMIIIQIGGNDFGGGPSGDHLHVAQQMCDVARALHSPCVLCLAPVSAHSEGRGDV
ncbi:hypothetical protein CAPTEDRAFT_228841 [Capitella teleta]|uniref:Uncharacterized protein n=1 Tax=Capitella teleta TaxID=283909 RepID=R7VJP4_CAPTE|nr:hypothetical protein CAPTEDRAFT_228841 [Capitella teleta]|eukprot:ELU16085.1 hypothetical protein CAPTEDRAFT_228841 [Capitella teleta]